MCDSVIHLLERNGKNFLSINCIVSYKRKLNILLENVSYIS